MVLKRRGWAKWLAWSFLLFTVAFARTAAATEIQYTLSDIMAQKITGDFSAVQDVVGTVAKANAGGCQLTFTGQNEISWTRTDCQALFEREPLVDLTFAAASGFKTTIAVGSTITLKPKMAAAPPPIVEIDKEALRVKTPPAGTKPYVYRFVGKELTKLTVDPNNGSFNVTAKDLGPNLKLYAEFDKEGTDLAGFVALDVTALAALEPKGNEKRPPAEPDDTEDFCVREPGDPEYVVCADLVPETENRTIEMLGPKGFVTSHVMVPNRAVIVKVRHEDTQSLEIKIKGDRGLVKPRLNDQAREAKPTKELTAVGKSEVSHLVTTRRFGPRQVGEVDITVAAKWKAQDGTEKKREELVELMVEETYFGALRIGVATVLGGATEQSFGVRSINGSKQPEIVPTSTGDADFELVLGFAP
ncbi:MAG: hypothetical protein KC766_10995, partial [Myxococcales bacterium]|nr:hypothetical protein [Myxococcales bacterium]